MGQGILLTVIGMATVFVALAVLAALIRILDRLLGGREGGAIQPAKGVPTAEGRKAEDLLPVIAAAVGAYLRAESVQVFLVPVERPDRSRWIVEGRVAALARREGL